METNNKYTKFEKLLQEKFSNHEMPYDNKEWLDFEKKLPKSPKSPFFPNKFYRFAIISASIIIPVLLVLFFANKYYSNTDVSKEQISISNSNTNKYSNASENNKTNNHQNCVNNNDQNKFSLNKDKPFCDSNDIKKTHNLNKERLNLKENISPKVETDNIVSSFNKNEKLKNVKNYGDVISSDINEGCAPLKIKFKTSINSDTISYLWNFGDKKTSSLKAPFHTYTNPGIYNVSLTIKFLKSKKTQNFTYSKTINVNDIPTANYSYDLNDEDGSCVFTDHSSDASKWNWTFGDKSTSNEKNPKHTYNKVEGTYNVQLVVYNTSGCSANITKKITLKPEYQYWVPNAFVPNGDGTNDFFGPVMGENMPSDGYEMSIYNKSGVLVFVTKNINILWDGKIKGTSSYAEPGTYIWKIAMKDKLGVMYEKTGYVNLLNFQ